MKYKLRDVTNYKLRSNTQRGANDIKSAQSPRKFRFGTAPDNSRGGGSKRTVCGRVGYKLIVFDIDGTLTRHVSSWQFLHEHLKIWDGMADSYQKKFLAGKISYQEFCRLDARHWKGLGVRKLHGLFRKIPYSKGARRYIHLLRKQGFRLAAISTGLQFNARRVTRELGLHDAVANELVHRRGRLTGGVRINVAFRGKARVLRKIVKKFKISLAETICVGDGEGDVAMAKLAGYSIAFDVKSERLRHAVDYVCRSRNFREVYDAIVNANLDALKCT